ncbi:hypothetical protein EVAR_93576_1 [Eumeta japonica]|uniref:Uncharacterized protein n=1 Tax=Eumeta variegata TaxID=151549 RepID=A0A4C1UR49_EUMVA|nr:hypothetical protein EVAR_93576_1 [Eumeta japonica]
MYRYREGNEKGSHERAPPANSSFRRDARYKLYGSAKLGPCEKMNRRRVRFRPFYHLFVTIHRWRSSILNRLVSGVFVQWAMFLDIKTSGKVKK